ncbi:hypothetical protein HPULCUR_007941 [Helicostylum pulchrum]|uniref:Beta-lactamase n=1 Tax=Helicostylum pulchrum TaxID=562976 RepID=A0ABP9Y676_9FUNG
MPSTGEDLYRKGQIAEEKIGKPGEVISYYERSARKGYFDASFRLGELYYQGGLGIEQDYNLSFQWYYKYLTEKNVIDQHTKLRIYSKICDMYTEGGVGFPKTYQKAYHWNRKCQDLNVKTLEGTCCLYRIGKLFEEGDPISFKKNYERALDWYKKYLRERMKIYVEGDKYDNKFVIVALKVARSYFYGKEVQVNYDRAKYWYETVTRENYTAEDYQNMGLIYKCGTNDTPRDYDKAVQCYTEASHGNILSAPLAIAELYQEGGHSLKMDLKEAFIWYKRASKNGSLAAKNKIGVFFENGYGVDVNFAEAFVWYKKAANKNFAPAQKNVGRFYLGKHEMKLDHKKAIEWFKKAVENGDITANNSIGLIYELENNSTEALKYFSETAKDPKESIARLKVEKNYLDHLGIQLTDEFALKRLEDSLKDGKTEADQHIESIKRKEAHKSVKFFHIAKEPKKFFAV